MLNVFSYEIRLINIIEMCYCFIYYIFFLLYFLLVLIKFIIKYNYLLVYFLNVFKFVKCFCDYIYWFLYIFFFIYDYNRRNFYCIDFIFILLLVYVFIVSKIGIYCGCRKDLVFVGSYFFFCFRRIKMEVKVWILWFL